MDAGWVVEVGGLLLVSPTGIKKKTPKPHTFIFFCFTVVKLPIMV